jgi:hypothetical protein
MVETVLLNPQQLSLQEEAVAQEALAETQVVRVEEMVE